MTNKGVALAQLRRYNEAEEPLRNALEIDPRDMIAWSTLGLCMSKLGRDQDAMQCFSRARALAGMGDQREIVR
jgi:Flp pilus assembly protein TadD